jgi:hypothetical protein
MEFFIEVWGQVGSTTNSTVSLAGLLDGKMDSKGMYSSPP